MNKGIQDIFRPLPSSYELINHILTIGFDTPMRRIAARLAVKQSQICHNKKGCFADNQVWLDVCTGTGEMAYHLSKYIGKNTTVIATDFTLPMIRYANKKRLSTKKQFLMDFILADSIKLPFKDNTFDLITMSFATRNINSSYQNLIKCFCEYQRILKPRGVFINLETSQPYPMILQRLFHAFIKTLVIPIGSFISRAPASYRYLSRTIPQFYDANELSLLIHTAGFEKANFNLFFNGIAAIHYGIKKDIE